MNNVQLGMWLFIASEVMLFGGLFSAYILLRSGATNWGSEADLFSLVKGLALSAPLLLAAAALRRGDRASLSIVSILGLIFLVLKAEGYWTTIGAGVLPSGSTFLALYFLLTGVHAVHVLLGVLVAGYLALRGAAPDDSGRYGNRVRAFTLYWYFVDIVWIFVFIAFYLL